MAGETIAHGTVEIEVNDRDALARLRELQGAVHSAMDDIGRQKAQPEIDAEIAPFKDAVENCKREIKKFQGIKATAELDADKSQAERAIRKLKTELKDLEGQKAEVELKVKADSSQIAAAEARLKAAKKELEDYKKELVALRRQEEKDEKARLAAVNKRARVTSSLNKQREREEAAGEKSRLDAINRRSRVSSSLNRQRIREEAAAAREAALNENARMAAINKRARVVRSLQQQQDREMAASHADALRMDRERTKAIYDQGVGFHKQTSQIIQLQREYAKLTDQAERLAKRRAYTVEGRAKLSLDRRGVEAKMLALKSELNAMGAHPPVDIKVDVNKRGLARIKQGFGQFVAGMAEKASNLGEVATRIGPFTMSLKQLGIALAFLGPTITDVAGAAGALVGVLGAGIAGSAAIGTAGLVGLGSGFLGLKFALRNTGIEFKNVRSYQDAYQKSYEKLGAKDPKTIQKLAEYKHALKTVSPLAREAALGIEAFYKVWDKKTSSTSRSAGNIAKGLFGAMKSIAPMWARSTNMLAQNLEDSLSGAFEFLKGKEFERNFTAITDNFNKSVPTMMHALGSFGRALLNFGREGSKGIDDFATGLDNLATKFLNFTQQKDFGETVKRWIDYAGDLMRLFGAATRVVVHFFGAGSKAGDSMVVTMTNALNRWDDFIQSTEGHNKIGQFFERAVAGTQALYKAFAPVVQLFVLWSAGLAPAVRVITEIAAAFTNAFNWAGKLVGLDNAFATLGATIGAAFAFSKIGAFIAGMSRVVGAMREIRSLSQGFNVLKNLPGIFKGGGAAGGIEAAGLAAAAEMRQGIIVGGAAAAAEMRAALTGGGAVGGAENAVGNLLGPNGLPMKRGASGAVSTVAKEAESGAKGVAKFGAAAAGGEVAATGLTAALGGVSLATAAAATGGVVLAGALAYFAVKSITGKNANDKFKESLKASNGGAAEAAKAYRNLATDATGVAMSQVQANMSLKQARADLKSTKDGTQAHHMALLNYRQAVIDNNKAEQDWKNTRNAAETVAARQIQSTYDAVKAFDKRYDGELKQLRVEEKSATTADARAKATKKVNDILAQREKLTEAQTRAENRASAVAANYARIYQGLAPVLGRAEQQLGRLAKSAPKLSRTIALKFESPKDVGQVASRASAALKSGVSKPIVANIVASSKNAEDAIRRLNAARITPKKLDIITSGGKEAVSTLEKIAGRKLTEKEQKIAQKGGPAVIALLAKILGYHIPDKHFLIAANDRASAVLNALRNQKLPPKYQDIFERVHSAGGGSPRRGPIPQDVKKGAIGAGPGSPSGMRGRPGDPDFDRAARNPVQRATGAMLRKATLLAGEQHNHPEFVIATNPAYRKRNQKLLQQAASRLGAVDIPKFGKGGATAALPGLGLMTKAGVPEKVSVAPKKPAPISKAKSPRKVKKGAKPKKANLKKQASQPWVKYVAVLQEQQGLWDQEVSYREGNVQEPDDFITERKDDKGNVTGYDLDTAAIESFKAQLVSVKEAYDALIAVITALMQAIPQAIQEITNEINTRNRNISSLDGAIDRNHNLAKEKDKDGKQTDSAKKAEARERKYRTMRDDEKRELSTAKEDKSQLIDANQQAVFDNKIAVRSRDGLVLSINGLEGKAKGQLADAQASGGGGGGGGSTADAFGVQEASANSMKMDVIRSFGGNMSAVDAGLGAAGLAGGGAVANPSGITGTSAAVVGALSGSSAARTTQSGSTASGATTSGYTGGMRGGGAYGGGAYSGGDAGGAWGGGGSTVTVNNTFATVPPDPHTWSKGVQFELGSLV